MPDDITGCPTAELWWTRVGRPEPDSLLRLLDAADRNRAGRFRAPGARARFVAARAMLRLLLARRLRAEPYSLRFATGPHGKPALANGPADLHFNLSHSGRFAVVAVAARAVGVDVEALRPVPRALRLADRFFADSERRWLASLPGPDRDRAFLDLWTCKEACAKALGVSLGALLSRIEVDPERPALLSTRLAPDGEGWMLLRARLPVPALCTVAAQGDGWRLDVREFDWGP